MAGKSDLKNPFVIENEAVTCQQPRKKLNKKWRAYRMRQKVLSLYWKKIVTSAVFCLSYETHALSVVRVTSLNVAPACFAVNAVLYISLGPCVSGP
jgi:hypothetical protein